MIIALTVALFILSIALHELAHARVMRYYGMPIKEICLLGLFGPKLFSFRWRAVFGDTPLTMRLVPLGAFVRMEEGAEWTIKPPQWMHIAAAGPAMNFLLAALMLFILMCADNDLSIAYLILLGLLLFLGIAPRRLSPLYPILGSATLFGLVVHILQDPIVATSDAGFAATGKLIAAQSASWKESVETAIVLNISLALVNSIPFFPLDGGRILVSGLDRYFGPETLLARVLSHSGVVFVIALFAWALIADGISVVRWFMTL